MTVYDTYPPNVNQNMRGKLPVGLRFRITAWTPVSSYNSSDGELYDRRTVVESKQLSVNIHEERNGNITINISLHLFADFSKLVINKKMISDALFGEK